MEPYLFAWCDRIPINIHLHHLYHWKLVLSLIKHVPCIHLTGILPFLQRKRGWGSHLVRNILIWCWLLDTMMWYTFTIIGTSTGFSSWPWWSTTPHQVSDGCWLTFGTTDGVIVGKLGFQVCSLCCE